MAVCITGMHRSGTSMVMSMLAHAGLGIGDEHDLIGANASNPDGHWENIHFVDLDDAVLSALGGGWDCPPESAVPQARRDVWEALRLRACRLTRDLGLRDPWGWKDPRVSLIAPFWLDVRPDLRFVICLRNPLDVAQSLRARAHTSYQLGLSLWKTYNERALAALRPDQRLVTHYSSYFARPDVELRRVCAFAGVHPDKASLDAAAGRIKPDRRHRASDLRDLIDAGIPSAIVRLYRSMCDEAGWRDPSSASRRPACHRERSDGVVNTVLLELEAARRHIATLDRVIHDQHLALEAASAPQPDRLDAVIGEQRERLDAVIGEQRERLDAVIGEQRERLDAIAQQIGGLVTMVTGLTRAVSALGEHVDYQRTIRHIRQTVERAVPRGSTVAVISKGDPDLLDLPGCRALHFPQADGAYAGYYPKTDQEALQELEKVRAKGAEFLLVPATAFWWLDRYRALAAHLQSREPIARDDDACIIFGLTGAREGGVTARQRAP